MKSHMGIFMMIGKGGTYKSLCKQSSFIWRALPKQN